MPTEPSSRIESPDPAGPEARSVALLVVHGIGRQRSGETLEGLIKGLGMVYGSEIDIHRRAADHAIVTAPGADVHLIEVYWADLLHGETVKGTFDVNRILEVAWFPLLNLRSGLLPAHAARPWRVRAWTAALAALSPLLSTGLFGARLLAAIPTGIAREHARTPEGRRAFVRRSLRPPWRRAREADHGRTVLDDLMDQVVGDVFNYVHGLRGAFPVESEANDTLVRQVAEIRTRFERAAVRAVDAGCTELQVLAHSLGTVVAFVSMCPEQEVREPGGACARLTRYYTIGSPLEKIRFFWPRLLEHAARGPAVVADGRLVAHGRPPGGALQWDNFYSGFDLVSGALQRFDGWPTPDNHRARGLGGLMTSHVAYNRHGEFLRFLGRGLVGHAPAAAASRAASKAGRTLQSALESLALPALIVLLATLGLVAMGGMGWLAGSLVAWPLAWAGWDRAAHLVRLYVIGSTVLMMTAGGVWLGWQRAREIHGRYWASPPSAPGP